jgi:cell division septum initiation protein DivIVA
MSGVSAGGGDSKADPVFENLAILANPAKLQERIDLLSKSTQEANDAWARVKRAETAEIMFREAEKTLEHARADAQAMLLEAEQTLLKAQADAALVRSNAKTAAEDLTAKTKTETDRLRASAKSARDTAAAKEVKADEAVKAADELQAMAKAYEAGVLRDAAKVAEREAAVGAREEEVEQKVQALAGMASILNVR